MWHCFSFFWNSNFARHPQPSMGCKTTKGAKVATPKPKAATPEPKATPKPKAATPKPKGAPRSEMLSLVVDQPEKCLGLDGLEGALFACKARQNKQRSFEMRKWRKSLKHELNPVNWEGLWWVLFIGQHSLIVSIQHNHHHFFADHRSKSSQKWLLRGRLRGRSMLKVVCDGKSRDIMFNTATRYAVACHTSVIAVGWIHEPDTISSRRKNMKPMWSWACFSQCICKACGNTVRNDEEHVLNFHCCHSMIEDVRSHFAETNYPQDSKMIWYTGRDSMRRKQTLSHWTRVWLEEYTPR